MTAPETTAAARGAAVRASERATPLRGTGAGLHVERRGEGPPLVLLHGFTGSSAAWREVGAALAARATLLAVDLPGHGCSPPPPRDAADALAWTADAVVDAVRACGVECADWIGYSLGGRIALHVALRHPACVRRLVLESCSPGIEDPAERAARAAADDALAEEIRAGGVEAFADRWIAQPLFRTQQRLPAPVRARERALRLAGSAEGLAGALQALSVGRQAPLWARLAEIAAPTLVVAGELDVKYAALARATAARIAAARLCIVADAGHTVHLERPEAFLAALEGFFTGAVPDGHGATPPGRSRPASNQGRRP